MLHKGKVFVGDSNTKHGNFSLGIRQKPELGFSKCEEKPRHV